MMLKVKIFLIVIFTIFIIVPSPSFAGCTFTAYGYGCADIRYKLKGQNKIERKAWFGPVVLEREGHYGGGCATVVGKNKARNRACENVMTALEQRFGNSPITQKRHVCQSWYDSSLQHPNEGLPQDILEADWIEITRFTLYALEKRIPQHSNIEKTKTITPASGRFRCNGAEVIAVTNDPDRSRNRLHNVDRPGSDCNNFESRFSPGPANWEQSISECERACMEDPNCKAWTVIKPGIQGRKARCWLKDSIPAPVRNNNCVSGVR